jgi:hypothetical protein
MKHSMLFSTLLVTLAACPRMDDAQFSAASDAQLRRMFAASSGRDATTAISLGEQISGLNAPTACPRITTVGNITTASGPCTSSKGGTWDGQLIAENVKPASGVTNPAFDPTKPGHVRFEQLTLTNVTGGHGTLDGFVDFDNAARTLDSDLTIADPDGSTTITTLHLACDQNKLCTAIDSHVDATNIGEAHIEGSWRIVDPVAGTIRLSGSETLTFDVGSTSKTTSCVPFSVDGQAKGQVCPPAPISSAL